MRNSLSPFSTALTVGSLDAYIHWVNQIPMLTQEEELSYATDLKNKGDLEAAKQLILSHLRLVVKIARGYAGYGLPQADLVQEGNIGLMKAVKRFDPRQGVRLVSFAIHWIRAEIHEFVLRNWRIVKIATTKAQRKLFFNLRKAAKKLNWLSDEEAKVVAEELNVPLKDVRQMEQRLNNQDISFDAPLDSEDEPLAIPAHYLEDARYNPAHSLENEDWEETRVQKLSNAMLQLDTRSQDILKARWLSDKKETLHTLAAQYQVSAERIRQIEQNAMQKIRELIQ